MSVPPSSSLPPSFSSFPDLDVQINKPRLQSQNARREGGKRKHGRVTQDKGGDSKPKPKKRKHGHNDATLFRPQTFDGERSSLEEESKYRQYESSGHLFHSDRKGDPLNIRYGGLYARNVPKYRLIDRGRSVLGLSFAWTVINRNSQGIEIGIRGRRKMPRLTDSSSRALLAAPPTRRVLHSDDTYKYKEIDGFLRLPSSRGRKHYDQSYSSITSPEDGANSDSESSSASDPSDDSDTSKGDSDTPVVSFHQETLKLLDQQLTAEPSSVDKWLLLLSQTLSTIPITSKNAEKARSEITLSILARALAADVKNKSSKLLWLKYLKAGEEVWHESKIRAEWEDALKVGGVEIWMEWLEWRIRKGNKGIDGVADDAGRALSILDHDEQGEIAKIRVLWRVAVIFLNAGFSERATALFQAQAELTFQVPPMYYGLSHESQLDRLEEFWESEVPRLGEKGAQGWASWVSSGKSVRRPIPTSIPKTQYVTDLDPYRQWAALESQADRICRLPTRSTDESDDADPYSTILFTDIRRLLLALRSPRAKNAFRLAWLSLLGLHVPGFSDSLSAVNRINWDDRWTYGYLTSPQYLDALFPSDAMERRLASDAVAGVIIGREKEYVSGLGPLRCWGYGVLGPLSSASVSEGTVKGRFGAALWVKEDIEKLDGDFMRCLFAQLRLGADDFEWDGLSLAFEVAVSVKGAVKHSRTLLSAAQNSLPHWAAHARLEAMRGRLDESRKVYQTVLVMSAPAMSPNKTGALWWDWAEMEWLAGGSDQSLSTILRSVRAGGRNGIDILRCKRSLEDAIGATGDETEWKEKESWIKLRALLELLTGKEPSAALTVFDEHLSRASGGTVQRESLLISCLLMLYHYGVTLSNPTPPSTLRERVEMALEEYPSNSIIIGLFLEGEKGQGVWGRVRKMLGEHSGKTKDVARRVAEVWIAGWERGRWTSEIERTRSGLAAAVDNERTRASPVVWRIYLEFEIRAGQLQRAKKMLFRAMGECPLTKELYLLAFGPLRGVFSAQELNGIADTMAERGLRLRTGIDDVLEGWNIAETEEKAESSDSGDEIVENARELRRLMPY